MLARTATARRRHSGRRIHHEQSRLPSPSSRRPLAPPPTSWSSGRGHGRQLDFWPRRACLLEPSAGKHALVPPLCARCLQVSPAWSCSPSQPQGARREPATARGMAMSVRLVRAPHKNDNTKDLVAFYVSIQGPWCKKDGPDCNLTYF